MRYFLEQTGSDKAKSEVGGQRKRSRAEVDAWIEDNIAAFGLDWRAGYTIKFKNSETTYTWKVISTGKDLKPAR